MTDHFLPGQRWVSHADSTLGLGIVTQADERRVTLHFPAVEEERVYATDRAPLTRLLLKPGDQLTRMDGSVLTVIALQEQGGVITYEAEASSGDHHSVVETELDAHIELNTLPYDIAVMLLANFVNCTSSPCKMNGTARSTQFSLSRRGLLTNLGSSRRH